MRNRALRILVGWMFPLPIIVCSSFLIGDLFYFNMTSPEYIRLSEDEYLLLNYLLTCVIDFCTLGPFLLAFSLLLEFGRRKVWRYCVAGVTGMTVGWFVSAPNMPPFAQLSRWHILEAASYFVGCTAIVMLVAMTVERLRPDELSSSQASLLP